MVHQASVPKHALLLISAASAFAFAFAFVVGCAGSSSDGDDAAAAGGSDLSSGSGSSTKLAFGDHSPIKKATGSVVQYTFEAGPKGTVVIDVDEAFVTGESALVDPPKNVTLTSADGKTIDAESQVFPGGGQANAGVELRASNLAQGTYTISYTGVAPHSYMVRLEGHNATGLNAPCDPKKGIRHNTACGDSLRCDDSDSICLPPSKKGGFCDTEKNGDDVCADGLTCQFDKATSQGDEGFNGLCQ